MKWTDILPRVLPYVPGCPRDTALQHIIDAARIFAARTSAWQYETTPILTAAGVADYTLQINEGEELVSILVCEVDSVEYEVVQGSSGRTLMRRGVSDICVPTGPQDFQLGPTPSQDGLSIIVDVAVKPATVGCDKWPDDLDQYVPDIAAGALDTLLRMPKVTWRDMDEAAAQHVTFTGRISTVAALVARNYSRQLRHRTSRFL